MTTVKERPGGGSGDSGAGQEGITARGRLAWRTWPAGLLGLIGRHRLISLALLAGVLPRLLSMIAYQPAVLFRLDTFDYLYGAVHVAPNPINPSGYSLFLWLLKPFHSLVLITALQHVMGLAIAVMVYALLRRRGLPSWGATLAALPVLFDPGQLLLEQFIMADLLALLLMVASFVILLWERRPSALRSAVAGLLMGVSVTVRPTTIVFIVLMAVYLLVQRAGWRRAGAALAAGVIPVFAYMGWFAAANGSFNLTNSNGLFLWSRTTSFARCSVIKPSPRLAPLCPERQPGDLAQVNPALRGLPKHYLWDHDAWQWQPPSRAFVPDTAAFTSAKNSLALQFAVHAILSEPLSYLHIVALDSAKPFYQIQSNVLRFPAHQPSSKTLQSYNWRYAIGTVRAYTGSDQGVSPYLGYQFGFRLELPWSYYMQDYQNHIFLPGPAFAVIVGAGLIGILLPRRRTSAALLLWVCAMIAVVLPIAEHEYTYRYVIPAVPLVCIALALAFRNQARDALAEPAAERPAQAAGPGPAGTQQDGGAGHEGEGAGHEGGAAREREAQHRNGDGPTDNATQPGAGTQPGGGVLPAPGNPSPGAS
ncbi:MAG: phospholipid carrier-dependent glycosyltransferase [Actinobacteria bacterium]|nr:phospholipid carrier-dependent glycosyltransferase [Actinomycetota bacterium]